jgi:hypothetical protein
MRRWGSPEGERQERKREHCQQRSLPSVRLPLHSG